MSILAGLHGFQSGDYFAGFVGDQEAGLSRLGYVRNALQTLQYVNKWNLQIYSHTVYFDDGTVVTVGRCFNSYTAKVSVNSDNKIKVQDQEEGKFVAIYKKDGSVCASFINFSTDVIKVSKLNDNLFNTKFKNISGVLPFFYKEIKILVSGRNRNIAIFASTLILEGSCAYYSEDIRDNSTDNYKMYFYALDIETSLICNIFISTRFFGTYNLPTYGSNFDSSSLSINFSDNYIFISTETECYAYKLAFYNGKFSSVLINNTGFTPTTNCRPAVDSSGYVNYITEEYLETTGEQFFYHNKLNCVTGESFIYSRYSYIKSPYDKSLINYISQFYQVESEDNKSITVLPVFCKGYIEKKYNEDTKSYYWESYSDYYLNDSTKPFSNKLYNDSYDVSMLSFPLGKDAPFYSYTLFNGDDITQVVMTPKSKFQAATFKYVSSEGLPSYNSCKYSYGVYVFPLCYVKREKFSVQCFTISRYIDENPSTVSVNIYKGGIDITGNILNAVDVNEKDFLGVIFVPNSLNKLMKIY